MAKTGTRWVAHPSAKQPSKTLRYCVVETGQSHILSDRGQLLRVPRPFGQDAFYQSAKPACRDNGDGTVTDRATGLMDVHGAGAQRSDPKSGSPADYPHGRGPQGDVISINNFAMDLSYRALSW